VIFMQIDGMKSMGWAQDVEDQPDFGGEEEPQAEPQADPQAKTEAWHGATKLGRGAPNSTISSRLHVPLCRETPRFPISALLRECKLDCTWSQSFMNPPQLPSYSKYGTIAFVTHVLGRLVAMLR
jgi:hypothetical protein